MTGSSAQVPRPTIFLDRDGVINRKMPEGRYVTTWDEFEFLPGAIEALARLKADGTRLVVVTNQRGVARGAMTLGEVDEIHRRMQEVLETSGASVDAIYVCPHEEGTCDCRKPRLGLFRQALANDATIDLARSAMIGDALSDLRAGTTLGIATCLVGTRVQLSAIEAADPAIRVAAAAENLRELVRTGIPGLSI